MKWFRHESNSHKNLKFQSLIDKFGWEGYGFFWILCELVAEQGKNYRIPPTKNWKKYFFSNLNISEEKCDELLKEMANSNLISKISLNKGILFIPKMKDYADNYTSRLRTNTVPNTYQLQQQDKTIHNNTRHKTQTPLLPQDIKLAQLLYDLIKGNTPNWYLKPKIEVWAAEIRKLREIDNQTPEEIEKVIKWCQDDGFWYKNILSTSKLRKQFPKLLVEMGKKAKAPFDYVAKKAKESEEYFKKLNK